MMAFNKGSLGGLLITSLLTLSLSGCIGNDMSDLNTYIAEVKARPPRSIEPLPQIKDVETFVYDDKGRRDPFSSDFGPDQVESSAGKPNGVRINLDRRKEELEQFPLDTLRMVGTLEQNKHTWALVRSQDGVIHRVKPGNYLGHNHGQISHISEEKIELTEIVPTGDGSYQERQATLTLGGLDAGEKK